MKTIIKIFFWITAILTIIILPAYIWNIVDRKSYENFLIKGVSPISQKSRNSILEKHQLGFKNF